MVILLHFGGEQFSLFFQGFLVLIDSKRWQFCVLINARSNVHIFRVTKSFSSSIDLILGHPVQQFFQKPEFSDFTVSGSGLPMGHRYWKYVSLFWSNLYIMATAPGGRENLFLMFFFYRTNNLQYLDQTIDMERCFNLIILYIYVPT